MKFPKHTKKILSIVLALIGALSGGLAIYNYLWPSMYPFAMADFHDITAFTESDPPNGLLVDNFQLWKFLIDREDDQQIFFLNIHLPDSALVNYGTEDEEFILVFPDKDIFKNWAFIFESPRKNNISFNRINFCRFTSGYTVSAFYQVSLETFFPGLSLYNARLAIPNQDKAELSYQHQYKDMCH